MYTPHPHIQLRNSDYILLRFYEEKPMAIPKSIDEHKATILTFLVEIEKD